MARYRKVHVCVWADAKFRALSSPSPNGQSLWLYLLTGPHTTQIPGLFTGGEAGLTEALGWPLEGFRKAFQEVFSQGMVEADWKARVVWLPNAPKYNPPESPNVALSWLRALEEIADCPLKAKAVKALKAFLEGLGQGFAKGFPRKIMLGACSPSPNQEQEQDTGTGTEEKHTSSAEADTRPPETPEEPVSENPEEAYPGFAHFWKSWPKHFRKTGKAKCLAIWKRQKLEPKADQVMAALKQDKGSPKWEENGGQFVPLPATWLNGCRWDRDETCVDEPEPVQGDPWHGYTDANGEYHMAIYEGITCTEEDCLRVSAEIFAAMTPEQQAAAVAEAERLANA